MTYQTELFIVLCGLNILLVVVALVGTQIDDYRSPTTGKLSTAWAVKVFLARFSYAASERWYESITHYRRGVFISMLSALHLLYVVRVDFASVSGHWHNRCEYHYYHGFRDLKTLKQLLLATSDLYRPAGEGFLYDQMSVAGYKVIHSWTHFDI